jgi:hypothetical protein
VQLSFAESARPAAPSEGEEQVEVVPA